MRQVERALWVLLALQLAAYLYSNATNASRQPSQPTVPVEFAAAAPASSNTSSLNDVPMNATHQPGVNGRTPGPAPTSSTPPACPEMDFETRKVRIAPWQAWMFDRGIFEDGVARRYRNIQQRELSSLADAGDAEALLQLGLNKIWNATRSAGGTRPLNWADIWSAERKNPDWVLFDEGVAMIERAAALGMDMSYLTLSQEMSFLFRYFDKIGGDPDLLLDLRARAYAYGEMPETLYPELHDNFYESRVFDETRRRAEQSLRDILSRREQLRAENGLVPHDGQLPDAYFSWQSDDWCRE